MTLVLNNTDPRCPAFYFKRYPTATSYVWIEWQAISMTIQLHSDKNGFLHETMADPDGGKPKFTKIRSPR